MASEALTSTYQSPNPNYEFIDNLPALQVFISEYLNLYDQRCTVYFDVHGKVHSSNLTFRLPSLLTILARPANKIAVIDLLALGYDALTTASPTGISLELIFFDSNTEKYCWNIARCARGLWACTNRDVPNRDILIPINNVVSIQLMENMAHKNQATREHTKYLSPLQKCLLRDMPHTFHKRKVTFARIRRDVYDMASGLSEAFAQRQIDPKIVKYCVNNVRYLQRLREIYLDEMQEWELGVVKHGSEKLARKAQKPGFDRRMDRGVSPWYDASSDVNEDEDSSEH
jgi:hypothetical protein